MAPEQLTDAEKVAIAGAIKSAELDKAKNALPDGFTSHIDLRIGITGLVQKGLSTPTMTVTRQPEPQVVSLRSFPAICSLLGALKVGEKRLAAALRDVGQSPADDPDFEAVFAAEEQRRAKKLKPLAAEERVIPGKRGTVTSSIQVSRL